MCGILGGLTRGPAGFDGLRVQAALRRLRHRGPDAEGVYSAPGILLGHRRLSIVDLDERANQPMRRGPHVLVFNGEIYNFRELRRDLEKSGHQFTTTSDTEVLLAAYEEYGIACVERFEGMFAFAVWDERRQHLFLARDRFGEKPLFYYEQNGLFLFSSEIAAIRELLSPARLEEDRDALGLYFLFSYIPAPYAPYRYMSQLEPGCWLKVDMPACSSVNQRYYDLRVAVQGRLSQNYAVATETLRQEVTAAVKGRLITSDVPVATFLSGGIDSSIVTALAAHATAEPVTAYSVAFPDDPAFDESPYALEVAKELPNLRHRVIPVSGRGLEGFVEATLGRLSEPFADASLIPTAYLCSQVEEKVILGGDGADELFGGYGVYPAMMMSAWLPRLFKRTLRLLGGHGNPHGIRHPVRRAWALFLKHLRDSPTEEYLSWRTYTSRSDVRAMQLGTTLVRELTKELAIVERGGLQTIQVADFIFNLPNDMLKKVDYASMFHSLEVRLPFLDSKLVEKVLSWPDIYKIRGRRRKRILRDAFASLLPSSILKRRKQGFLLPVRTWFRSGRLHEQLRELVAAQDVFDRAPLRRRLDDHAKGAEDNSVFLWTVLVYLRWRQS